MLILNFTYPLRCLRVPPVEYHWSRGPNPWYKQNTQVFGTYHVARLETLSNRHTVITFQDFILCLLQVFNLDLFACLSPQFVAVLHTEIMSKIVRPNMRTYFMLTPSFLFSYSVQLLTEDLFWISTHLFWFCQYITVIQVYTYARFEVFTAVKILVDFFWVVTP
jgi:hypothetical protein